MAHVKIPVLAPASLLRRALLSSRIAGAVPRPGVAARWKPANRLALRAFPATLPPPHTAPR